MSRSGNENNCFHILSCFFCFFSFHSFHLRQSGAAVCMSPLLRGEDASSFKMKYTLTQGFQHFIVPLSGSNSCGYHLRSTSGSIKHLLLAASCNEVSRFPHSSPQPGWYTVYSDTQEQADPFVCPHFKSSLTVSWLDQLQSSVSRLRISCHWLSLHLRYVPSTVNSCLGFYFFYEIFNNTWRVLEAKWSLGLQKSLTAR